MFCRVYEYCYVIVLSLCCIFVKDMREALIIVLALLASMIVSDLLQKRKIQPFGVMHRPKRFTKEENGMVSIDNEDIYELVMYVYEIENALHLK